MQENEVYLFFHIFYGLLASLHFSLKNSLWHFVSQNSCRLSSFFFIFFHFNWIVPNDLFWVHRLFLLLDQICCWCSLLHCSFHSLHSSALEFVWLFFMVLPFCWTLILFIIIFLILLSCIFVFSCSLLNFFDTIILSSSLTICRSPILWVSYWKIIVFLLWCHVSLIFVVSRRIAFVCAFDGSVTSSRLYRMVLVGKGLRLWVAAETLTGWLWLFQLQGSPSGIVSMQLCQLRSSLVKTAWVLKGQC